MINCCRRVQPWPKPSQMACQTRVTDTEDILSHSALPWLECRPWPHRGDLGVPWYCRNRSQNLTPQVKRRGRDGAANAAFSNERMIDALTACAIIFSPHKTSPWHPMLATPLSPSKYERGRKPPYLRLRSIPEVGCGLERFDSVWLRRVLRLSNYNLLQGNPRFRRILTSRTHILHRLGAAECSVLHQTKPATIGVLSHRSSSDATDGEIGMEIQPFCIS